MKAVKNKIQKSHSKDSTPTTKMANQKNVVGTYKIIPGSNYSAPRKYGQALVSSTSGNLHCGRPTKSSTA